VGIASPEGAVFTWDIKSFTDKYHMEAVPGSKQFIALMPGNVKANIQIEWPAQSYLNNFQVCTEVSWDLSDEDFWMFMNNNTLPGQKKNVTAEPTVSYSIQKGKHSSCTFHCNPLTLSKPTLHRQQQAYHWLHAQGPLHVRLPVARPRRVHLPQQEPLCQVR
jgi:hypothetical protein